MSIDEVRALLRKRAAEETASAFAKAHGFSPQYLSDILKGRREPGAAVLAALGLVKRVDYTRADAPTRETVDG